MFRLNFIRFIATSRVALSSPIYLPHAQRRFFQKYSSQSNENPVLSTIPTGNTNKGDESSRIGIRFCSKMHEYNIK
jgi:hypothetical protein